MIIKEMTGYMLANDSHVESGKKWCPYDTTVYVCLSIEKAKEILAQSHKNYLEPGTIWTTIYRVNASEIDCQKIGNGLAWTNQPTKIIVEGPVYYNKPKQISENEILQKAARVLPHYSRLMNQVNNKENKR